MKVTGSSSRHALNTGFVIVLFQAVSSVQTQNASGCVTKACLVSTLLASTNQYVIPSEKEGCKVEVKITNISIETLEVDTKNLYFVTILRMTMVNMRSQIYKVLVSLIIPSIMILLANVVGFAFSILDGERVSYKVTLVLGFVMFLLILTEILPGSPKCIPLLSQHFTITLVFLLLSLIETVLVTYLAAARAPSLTPPWKKGREAKQHPEKEAAQRQQDEGQNGVAPGLHSDTVFPGLDAKPLQRIISFIDCVERQEQDAEKRKSFAAKVDKVYFTVYMLVLVIYLAVMLYMFLGEKCSVNHLNI